MTRLHAGGALVFLMFLVPIALFSQTVRVAELSLGSISSSPDGYTILAAAVRGFDVVAAADVRDAGSLEKVLAAMDEDWEACGSRNGVFGFFYNDRVQLVKELGLYGTPGQFARPPYGAQFRLLGSGFLFNLVACQIVTSSDSKAAAAEIAHLADVYRYFERVTGNRGTTILAGRIGDEHEQATKVLGALAGGRVMAVRGVKDERMIASAVLRPRIEDAGIGRMAPHPVYMVLKPGKSPR